MLLIVFMTKKCVIGSVVKSHRDNIVLRALSSSGIMVRCRPLRIYILLVAVQFHVCVTRDEADPEETILYWIVMKPCALSAPAALSVLVIRCEAYWVSSLP